MFYTYMYECGLRYGKVSDVNEDGLRLCLKVNVIELYLHCSNRLNDVFSVHTVLRSFKDDSTQSRPMCHGMTLRNVSK